MAAAASEVTHLLRPAPCGAFHSQRAVVLASKGGHSLDSKQWKSTHQIPRYPS